MSKWRSILATVALIALLPVSAVQASPAAQVDGRWTSPTYGFTVEWDTAVWEEEPAEALTAEGPEELDRLLLLGEIGPLYVEGARRYDGVASECVTEELAALGEEPDFTDARRLPEYDADGPDASAGAVQAILTQPDGEETPVIAYVQCMRAGTDAVAIATLLAPVDEFADHFAQAEPVLASMTPAGGAIAENPAFVFSALLEEARANVPLVTGKSGSLEFGPGVMATSEEGISVADFAASATFANPWDGAKQPFDFGFAFRHTGMDEHMRLIIDSNGGWALQNGLETVASGAVTGVRSGAGESNTLELVAQGGTGWFAVNGEFVDTLDLSGRSAPGDLLAASGFFSENATIDGETRFTRLSVWPLSAAVEANAEATAEPGPATAGIDERSFAAMLDGITAAEAAAGPMSGVLIESDGEASLESSGVTASDFAARVRWINPDGNDPWEIGVAFRDQPDGSHYRLTFDQTGRWLFGVGTEEKSATGDAPSLRLGPGAQNALELVVDGEVAGFAVNGVFVAELDVSEITAPGGVWVGSGFDVSATRPGRETRFRDFTVWSTAPLLLPDEEPADDGKLIPLPPVEGGGEAGADAGMENVLAVLVEEVDGSGVTGLATITDVQGEAFVNLVLRGGEQDDLAVIHAGYCSSLSIDPLFLLDDLDDGGRSKSPLGVPVTDLLDQPLALAIYEDISTYGTPVACGEIR